MPFLKLGSLSCLAAFAFAAALPQDPVPVARTLPAAPARLRFAATHAETFTVEGDPKQSLRFNGDGEFSAAAAPGAAAGEYGLTPTFGAFTTNWWQGDEKDPFSSHAVRGPALVQFKEVARLTKERVLDAPAGFPDTLGVDWYSSTDALAKRVARAVSAGDGAFALQTKLNLAFPPLPATAAKGARFDADYVAGYFGREAQVQVFYASTVESVNEKSIVFKQSGAAQLVKFPQPASRRSDGWTFDVAADRSVYSATVEISRADGAVLKREGELTLLVKAADAAKPAAPPTFVTAKMWTKIERRAD
jgi:hypothetical protein